MRVLSLHEYPLKSGQANDVETVTFSSSGFRNDRAVMLIDENGVLVSQRQVPEMARIAASVSDDYHRGKNLLFSFDGQDVLSRISPSSPSPVIEAVIHGEQVMVREVSSVMNDIFSAWLKKPVRLVFEDASAPRTINKSWHKEDIANGFRDGAPVLITNPESLKEINEFLDEAVPMNRFRPNIVLDGVGAAFVEQGWQSINIGGHEFDIIAPCTRCGIPSIDQETGARTGAAGAKLLKTIANINFHEWVSDVTGKTSKGMVFGVYAIPRGNGEIKVADEVRVSSCRAVPFAPKPMAV